MNKQSKVFVSSISEDMVDERQVAYEAIRAAGHIPVGFDLIATREWPQFDVRRNLIDASDLFLLILNGRYGSIDKETNKSSIELDYEYAVFSNKLIIPLEINWQSLREQDLNPLYAVFRSKVNSEHFISSCSTLDQLRLTLNEVLKLNQLDLLSSKKFGPIPNKTTRVKLVIGDQKVDSVSLRLPHQLNSLPGFSGVSPGVAVTLMSSGRPLAGVLFPVMSDQIDLSQMMPIIWPRRHSEVLQSELDAFLGKKRLLEGEFASGRINFDNAGFRLNGDSASSRIEFDFAGVRSYVPTLVEGASAYGRLIFGFASNSGFFELSFHLPGEVHAYFRLDFVGDQSLGRLVLDLGSGGSDISFPLNEDAQVLKDFRKLLSYIIVRSKANSLKFRVSAVTYDADAIAACSPLLDCFDAIDHRERKAKTVEQTATDETTELEFSFGEGVSEKDMMSILGSLHQSLLDDTDGEGLVITSYSGGENAK
jgi:hypothetical protein